MTTCEIMIKHELTTGACWLAVCTIVATASSMLVWKLLEHASDLRRYGHKSRTDDAVDSVRLCVIAAIVATVSGIGICLPMVINPEAVAVEYCKGAK